MANELQVDAAGLRAAATSSGVVAATLISADASNPSATHASAVGVAAMNAALKAVHGRQSALMAGQSGNLSTSSARYDTTDSDGGVAIAATMSV